MRTALAVLLLPALTLACSGCGTTAPPGTEPGAEPPAESTTPTPDRVIAVRLLDGDSSELPPYLDEVADDLERWSDGWSLRTLGDGEPLPDGAVMEILAGLLPLRQPLPSRESRSLDGLPVSLSDGEVRLAGESYPDPAVAMAVQLDGAGAEEGAEATPERWLVTGQRSRPVARLVAERVFATTGYLFAGWEGGIDYMLRQADWKRRAGVWETADGGVRAVDRRDDFATARRWLAELSRLDAGAVTLLLPAAAESAPPWPEDFAAGLASALEGMAGRLGGGPLADRPVSVAVEIDHTQQIRHTSRVGEAVVDGLADVHLVYHPRDAFAYRHALARVLLARAGLMDGLPPYLAAGAALWLSGDWYGRPWPDWLPRLAAAGVLPTAGELLAAEELPDGSTLLWAPVAARVIDDLPGATLAEKLEQVPTAREVERALATLVPLTAPPAPPRPVELPPFHAGVSLAMLNHLELGYHAPSMVTALTTLRDHLGANAVALMPFAFQRDAAKPAMVYLNGSPQSETDMAMIHAGRRADGSGMAVLWKPQIWLSRSWPGDVEMTSEEDWRAWWRSYHRFVVHQALLAEWVGAEMLSVGTELGRTVHRGEEWRRLIGAVRILFAGRLTYAGNWFGDFEEVPWWDALDFLGVDAYQPLSESPAASREELVAGARRMLRRLQVVAEREQKPLLMTEIGYAAHEAAWVAPHEEGGTYSPRDQALAYEALFAAIGEEPPSWLRGMYLWKAFSNAAPDGAGGWRRRAGGGGERADFRFLGREAEPVIRRFYADFD